MSHSFCSFTEQEKIIYFLRKTSFDFLVLTLIQKHIEPKLAKFRQTVNRRRKHDISAVFAVRFISCFIVSYCDYKRKHFSKLWVWLTFHCCWLFIPAQAYWFAQHTSENWLVLWYLIKNAHKGFSSTLQSKHWWYIKLGMYFQTYLIFWGHCCKLRFQSVYRPLE